MADNKRRGSTTGGFLAVLKWGLFGGLFVLGVELLAAGCGILFRWWVAPNLKVLALVLIGGFAFGFLAMVAGILEYPPYSGHGRKNMM
jgi:hypothetical protein